MVKIHTSKGVISLKLFEDKAPDTVKNFLDYASEGFYNGTIFHRVIDNFMIQGGGMEPGMKEKSSKASIKNEADNGLSNSRGTIAMARTPDPHSATSQFFINVADNTFLDFKSPTSDGFGYCVFGEVVDGMDVMNEIKNVSTTSYGMHQDVPAEDIVITKVEVTA